MGVSLMEDKVDTSVIRQKRRLFPVYLARSIAGCTVISRNLKCFIVCYPIDFATDVKSQRVRRRKMKNKLTYLLTTIFLFGANGFSSMNALAADHTDNRGLPDRVLKLEQDVGKNTADIQTNAANIADNFSQIQSNRSDIIDLDSRVLDLEAGGTPGGGRTFVDVDCAANANALLEPPINGSFPDNTTYNITGACNGPLYVTEDGVRFVGTDPNAAIVLPGGIDPSNGAVFGDGAQDLRIQNLLIDASAWGSGLVAEGTDAAGVYARNAFIRVINTRIVGGLWGINPFRNAIVRTQGIVEITGYVNSAISVGDQSLITARGPVFMSSDVTDGSYLGAIDIYRSGVMDFRAGVTVNQPPADPAIGFFPYAIGAYRQSHLRIRNNGPIDIQGDVFLNMLGTANIDGGNLNGNVNVQENSALTMRNTSHSGDLFVARGGVANIRNGSLNGFVNGDTGGNINFEFVNQNGGGVFLGLNSSARFAQSTVGMVDVQTGSVLETFEGEINGANLNTGAAAIMSGTSVTAQISANKPSALQMFPTFPGSGNLNGNNVIICDEETVEIDPGIAATGSIIDVCP